MQIISRDEATSAGLTHYFTGVPCKHGHLDTRYTKTGGCSECMRCRVRAHSAANPEKKKLSDRRSYEKKRPERLAKAKVYREVNAESVSAIKKDWYERNRDEVAAKKKVYREENSDTLKAAKKRYYDANRDDRVRKSRQYYQDNRVEQLERMKVYREENRESLNTYFRERRKRDPLFKMGAYLRNMLRRILKASGATKEGSSSDIVGYGPTELKAHIESLFTDGMSWDNYGSWHIDHKVPVSIMTLFGIEDPAVINALSNLQPMWAVDNLTKGNRFASE